MHIVHHSNQTGNGVVVISRLYDTRVPWQCENWGYGELGYRKWGRRASRLKPRGSDPISTSLADMSAMEVESRSELSVLNARADRQYVWSPVRFLEVWYRHTP